MHCLRCGAELVGDELACTKCGYLEDITADPKTKRIKVNRFKEDSKLYAGFWQRSSALTLDFLILIAGVALFAGVIGGIILLMSAISGHRVDFHIIRSFAVSFGVVFAVGLNWAYFTWFESSEYQATFGKKIMGIKVVDVDNKRIPIGQANIRYWFKLLSLIILVGGFWMMLFTEKKRTLHDLIAGTMVIKQGEKVSEKS